MKKRLHLKNVLAFLGVATFFWIGPPAHAQTQDTNPPPRANDSRSNDTTRPELRSFDQFLDSHREIAEQLQKDPSLLKNTQFVRNHPALDSYLQQHPQVREEILENPAAFMRQENRYDRGEDARDRDMNRGDNDRRDVDARRDNDNRPVPTTTGATTAAGTRTASNTAVSNSTGTSSNTGSTTNSGTAARTSSGTSNSRSTTAQSTTSSSSQAAETQPAAQSSQESIRDDQQQGDQGDRERGELARFDQFLDGHREIAEQLRRNPSLANNQQYLNDHPALQTYLQDHPAIQAQLTEHPDAFMQREDRYDRNEGQLARLDQFLDGHREIAEQLRRNPSLANNQQYLKDYPALQTYLQDHPAIQAQLTEHPDAFMQREDRYDYREDARDRNMNQGELARFDQFLDGHRGVAEQLRRNPSLADNQQYLKDHPALQTYLQDHPAIQAQLTEHPDAFMQREDRYDNREDARDRNMNQGQLARFDQFLDGHREIADQVRKNPSLLNNQQFVQNHPALQTYLQQNPGVRQQLAQNPSTFMQREDRYDAREDAHNNNRLSPEELSSFDRFLDSHREEAEQLRRDPSLATNRQFVQNHPALQAYLQDHQGVREQLAQNPSGFMRDNDRTPDAGHMQQAANFRDFLGGHSGIAQDLSRNPTKANDPDYQRSHPELRTYLSAHPDVQSALTQNPQNFMKTVQQPAAPASTTTGTTGTTTTGTTGATKTPPPPPKPPMR
jgi:hypothetical protein